MNEYLASLTFDPALKKMSFFEMLAYMRDKPKLEHAQEYMTAHRVMKYNNEPGELTGYDCPECKNKGLLMTVDDAGNEVMLTCKCMVQRRNIRNAEASGMGDMLHKSFENYTTPHEWQKKLLNGAKYYIANQKNEWFTMLGQSGAGKSHLCSAVANQFLNSGKTVVYMTWNNAVKELKRNAIDDFEYSRMFDRYCKADVLFIDDLFKDGATDADKRIAFELINYRYNNGKAITVISSEISLAELCEMDEALAGRIKERCGRYLIDIAPDPKKNYRFEGAAS